jgi:hypothetical protein
MKNFAYVLVKDKIAIFYFKRGFDFFDGFLVSVHKKDGIEVIKDMSCVEMFSRVWKQYWEGKRRDDI